ncbi:cobalt ECF transporter T component CbiQ [Paenibacillus hexagrammi]|uniref:Cobalt ECF transporter T component CbiQ n=1 Tax=Paenibacillus hexagrammi TaxID=2908839 RepID=A0ABY3SN87_9BACL|nr:cobalt ECF transporter T component CbiQ [Paenibacillus sp. YPD9-1]UJF34452.1 cobalt ECF transporter T component CbiQ [Paenibacillus sp. YPD9-1]
MMKLIDALSYNNKLRTVSSEWRSSFAAILFLLSYLAHPFIQILVLLWMSVWIVAYAGIPLKYFLTLLSMSSVFFLASLPGILIEFTAGTFLISASGLSLALHLWLRTTVCVSCMLFLVFTVPVSEWMQLLNKLRVPSLVIEIMMIMYRFLFVLSDTAHDMFVAQRARGGHRGLANGLRDTAMIIVRLFAKTMYRYKALSFGLLSRGFTEHIELPISPRKSVSLRYWTEGLLGILLLIMLEWMLEWKGER